MQFRRRAILGSVTALAFVLCGCQPTTSLNHRAEDIAAIQQLAVAIDHAVDDKRWDDLPRFFAKDVAVNYETLTGAPPATLKAVTLAQAMSQQPAGVETFHMRSPGIVSIKTNTASLKSKAHIWKTRQNETGISEVWGVYTYALKRRTSPRAGDATNGTDGDGTRKRSPWMISAIEFEVVRKTGPDWNAEN